MYRRAGAGIQLQHGAARARSQGQRERRAQVCFGTLYCSGAVPQLQHRGSGLRRCPVQIAGGVVEYYCYASLFAVCCEQRTFCDDGLPAQHRAQYRIRRVQRAGLVHDGVGGEYLRIPGHAVKIFSGDGCDALSIQHQPFPQRQRPAVADERLCHGMRTHVGFRNRGVKDLDIVHCVPVVHFHVKTAADEQRAADGKRVCDAHGTRARSAQHCKKRLRRTGVQCGDVRHLYKPKRQNVAEKCGYLHARQKRKRVSRPPDGVIGLRMAGSGVMVCQGQHAEVFFRGVCSQ